MWSRSVGAMARLLGSSQGVVSQRVRRTARHTVDVSGSQDSLISRRFP